MYWPVNPEQQIHMFCNASLGIYFIFHFFLHFINNLIVLSGLVTEWMNLTRVHWPSHPLAIQIQDCTTYLLAFAFIIASIPKATACFSPEVLLEISREFTPEIDQTIRNFHEATTCIYFNFLFFNLNINFVLIFN